MTRLGPDRTWTRLGELLRLFVKLGTVAFGGPAAHIAMMDEEVVERRRWLDRGHFLDLVGATNLIPGPNSTEMTMHVGFERAGWRGLLVAGGAFILPAVAITGGLAWLYVEYGTVPALESFLYGIRAAVIAVILTAVWRLGRSAIAGVRVGAVAVAVVAAAALGVDEVTALLAGAALGGLWLRATGGGRGVAASGNAAAAVTLQEGAGRAGAAVAGGAAAAGVSLWQLGLFFLKVGAVLYGSGYVLVAFIQGGLVEDYGWLTRRELLDAVAVGQFTPGPVLSTATFVGYLVAGWPGAAVATVAIFLPSFLFVLALNPVIPRLRRSAWAAAFLDAVNAAAVALMAVVTVELGAAALTSWPAWTVAAAAAVAAIGFKVGPAWVVLGGALLGRALWPWAGG